MSVRTADDRRYTVYSKRKGFVVARDVSRDEAYAMAEELSQMDEYRREGSCIPLDDFDIRLDHAVMRTENEEYRNFSKGWHP